jgi:hypothetical protein
LEPRDIGGNARGGLLGRLGENIRRECEHRSDERTDHHGFRLELPHELRGEFCVDVRELMLTHGLSLANILRQYFATQKFSRAIICQFIGSRSAELTTDSHRRKQRSVHGFATSGFVERSAGND